jgi:hypothetical protein
LVRTAEVPTAILTPGDLVLRTTTSPSGETIPVLGRVDTPLEGAHGGGALTIGGHQLLLAGAYPEQHRSALVLHADEHDVNDVARADTLNPRLQQLNRRAASLGCEPVRYQVVRSYTLEHSLRRPGDPDPADGATDTARHTQIEHRSIIRVTANPPKLNGWACVATIEHTPERNVIRAAPGQLVPDRYRTVPPHCDHCHQPHRRADTYLLCRSDVEADQVGQDLPRCLHANDPTGSDDAPTPAWALPASAADSGYRQVGSACLAAFTGHPDPAPAIGFLILVSDALGEVARARSGPRLISTETYLRFVAAVIRRDGYVSTRTAEERFIEATAQRAERLMRGFFRSAATVECEADRYLGDGATQHADAERVRRALRWARVELEPTSGHEHNLKAVVRLEGITPRHYGLAASLLPAFDRYCERRLFASQTAGSQHVGTLSQRATFADLTVTSVTPRKGHGARPTSHLYRFVDPQGNFLEWLASHPLRDPATAAPAGPRDVVTLRATVKTHDEFRATKRTVLTRAKLERLSPAPAQAHTHTRPARKLGPGQQPSEAAVPLVPASPGSHNTGRLCQPADRADIGL